MRLLLRPCYGILAALCLLPCLAYGQADVKASPASVSFGPVLVGQTSLPKVVSPAQWGKFRNYCFGCFNQW
jgi:hypothetical protein